MSRVKTKNKDNNSQLEFDVVTFVCPICGKVHTLMLAPGEFIRYKHEREVEGKMIQDIFPDMNAQDREKFITQMCDDCQKLIFGA